MKRKFVGAFLVCTILLTLIGLGQAQLIAPPPSPPLDIGEEELAVEVLMGLIGNYMAKMQEYQDIIEQGGIPDSAAEFRLAAKVTMADAETDSELDAVLMEISRMALWVKGSVFSRYPGFVKIDLSGTLGGMEILTTPTESIIIFRDEAVFTVLTPDMEMPNGIFDEEGISDVDFEDFGDFDDFDDTDFDDVDFSDMGFDLFDLEMLQEEIGVILLESLSDIATEYGGFEMTSRGMAHIVRLTFIDTGETITLWVLDETWDLCKVGFDDIQGVSLIMVIGEAEFVSSPIPDSVFDIDTSSLVKLPYEEFLTILDLKLLSAGMAGIPVAADLAVSLPVAQQGDEVIVSSNGMDDEDAESDLVAQIEGMGPDGLWTALEAVYVGNAPLGRWEAAFVPSELGSYSFSVAYTDSSGAVSDPVELLSVLDVIVIPPQVVEVSPADQEADVPLSSQVVVTFSQGMDQASVEAAFSLTDSAGQAVSGSFEWVDSTFVFRPDQDLMYGQDYLAKILNTAMNLNEAALDDDFAWTFTTEYAPLPNVAEFSPDDRQFDVLVSAQISVTFTEAMDQTSVESAFSLTDSAGQVVSGAFEWTDSTFAFKPDQELTYGQGYLAKVLGSAVSLDGAALDADADGISEGSPNDDLVWRFTTEYAPLPGVAEFSPGDKELNVLVLTQVSVAFTEAMDQASVEDAFSLSSTAGVVSGSFEWSDNVLTFTPAQNLEYNTTYRVAVRGSAASELGICLDANKDGVADGSPRDDLAWWFSSEKFPVLAAKPASQTGMGGDFINVDIMAQSVAQLSSFALTIDFDPAILKLLKVQRASFVDWRPRPKFIENVDVWQPTVIDDEQGLIVMAADSTRSGGVTGTGTIATLTFQAIGVGESPIELKDVSFTNALGEAMTPDLRGGKVEILEFAPWDVNKDGMVNILDFIIIQNGRGANSDVNGDGVTDMLDMVAAAGNISTSPALIPTVNKLLRNFPNPFNPETWIPYQIISGDDVVVRIYGATGKLVRTIDLGYKHAGRHAAKSTAAYWDGNNEDGERVASGIYYYAIKTGDFSAVRKMVVSE